MAGKKNPSLGDKLRQEREGAENTLRDSRSKTADSITGDSSKKKKRNTEGRFVMRPILPRCAARS